MSMRFYLFVLTFAITSSLSAESTTNADSTYADTAKPVLEKYCFSCHSGDTTEGDLDFSLLTTLDSHRQHVDVWLKVRHTLGDRQMPPKEADQPTEAEWTALTSWVQNFLQAEAKAHAGDPGPIVLRRLNNDEYRYVIQDLTGIQSLDPTREFPIDGAAGEGFTNTGSGQGMSPALLQKYLDAGKDVANHISFLPHGLEFTPETTRRDRTDSLKNQIRDFYHRYTDDQGSYAADLQGVRFQTNAGGRLPIRDYLAALLKARAELQSGSTTLTNVASASGLSRKYLATLWNALQTPADTFYVQSLQQRWQQASADEIEDVVAFVEAMQQDLWKFNTVGHVAPNGTPRRWLEPVEGWTTRHAIKIPVDDGGEPAVIEITGAPLGRGTSQLSILNPRLEYSSNEANLGPSVRLNDLQAIRNLLAETISRELGRSDAYLSALSGSESQTTAEIAASAGLNPALLTNWSKLVGVGPSIDPEVAGHFTEQLKAVSGYADINGWGRSQTPLILANRANEPISFSTLTVPARGVTAHPSPTQSAVVGWQSPVDGEFELTGLVADADNKCGNGAEWLVEHRSKRGRTVISHGLIDNGGRAEWRSDGSVDMQNGDVIAVLISPRDGNHTCDTTHIDFTARQTSGGSQQWNLAHDIVDRILESNPLEDSYGNPDVWHLAEIAGTSTEQLAITPDSTLAQWRDAVLRHENERGALLAKKVRASIAESDTQTLSAADRAQRDSLNSWTGPLDWIAVAQVELASRAASMDSRDATYALNGDALIEVAGGLTVQIPSELISGATFVADIVIDDSAIADKTGGVLLDVKLQEKHESTVLIADNDATREQAKRAAEEFRDLFPIVVCYPQIVPVDEVVTLTLFHREDDHLKRLMLSEAEAAHLDRLWEQLEFVSQEPLQLVVALEQLEEFSTQGGDPDARPFEYLRKPVADRAKLFREKMLASEPSHLDDVLGFAGRLWRRPLSETERTSLISLYEKLRSADLSHEDAVGLVVARVLTAPAFLYKLEQPAPGSETAPVSNSELAARLSFFLWSTAPDDELRALAEAGQLQSDSVLKQQVARMLDDERIRRLSIQFACQWLHLRNFDQEAEKNEALYPEFHELRSDMYEETVRFFEHLFRNNGSVLELLNADYTFVNKQLARHYGIDGVTDDNWQRVDNAHAKGRGGVLAMATVLASQSGASRTSPILRGNWVYETILGEKLPRPPAGVPILPETPPAGLTARQLIEQHSSDEACARCHLRIDPYGFALEQYDAIGRLRPEPADTATRLPSGQQIQGIEGLRTYLVTQRRDDFVKQFCRKLLGYALGREVQLSDEPFIEDMGQRLADSEYRFHTAVEMIVLSPQFRTIRGQDFTIDR